MDQAASPTTTTGCPPNAPTGKNAPVCDDPDCVGKSNICSEGEGADGELLQGEWKYCKCLDLMHPIFEPVSEDTLNQQQEVLAAIISEAPTKPEEPKATCSPNANPYTDPIDMDIPFAHNLAAVFCKGDTSKEMKADLTNEDITSGSSKRSLLDKRTPPASSKSFPGYTFHFEYSPGEGDCSQDCTDAMKSLISKCENSSPRREAMG
ncbi:hypothetical protein MPH_11295 [Macrophomina phaseolina MS6]|uniref:Uncharacterized protein n=1 Tax=Macrophomina phaseolina (strain MS6) TaxID=1126212 RepID=K2RNL2_MACPH|nr:hypothetical protein MPH_11295 [Macrophomina phaseolina MS6]